jgi:ligand-binding sensor domain-containing protein
VWFGGAEGVWRYSIAEKEMHRAAEGLQNPHVNVLLSTGSKDNRTLWAGTRQGLAKYDSNRQRWMPLSFNARLPSPNVTALAFQEGILWIGTPRGLGSYTIASDSWNSLSNVPYNIRNILCEARGILWLATDTGLVEYDTQNGRETLHQSRPVREPFLETKVSNIKFDGNYIWFNNWAASPNGGIVRFHRPTATWRRFTRLDILKSTQKRSMTLVRWTYVDTDAVWFTTDYGVLRYDKISDTWQHFTPENGLSTDDVDKIAVSEQSVWVTPMIGLELNHYSKATGTWKVVEEEDIHQIERLNARVS